MFQPAALANPVIAQSNPITNVLQRIRGLLTSTPQSGAPTGRTKGGAGRGRFCPTTQFSVSALVPSIQGNEQNSQDGSARVAEPEIVFGTTVEANPTFWFYVPYQAEESLRTASFVLLDDQERPVLPEPILISFSNTPGIIRFQLPYSLAVNQLYNWYFSILCDPLKPSRNSGVRGWIQRVDPSTELLAELEHRDSVRPYMPYAENGIWFEAVTYLARSYYQNADNSAYQQDWADLLDSIGLSELRNAPIVDCCG
ncbi:DUF928 domain-containing protein [Cyanobacteria bacterium FACHB-471]|nr:DUF928 domain-containing protein [Cyanobacteria bacterium FACHB-471]